MTLRGYRRRLGANVRRARLMAGLSQEEVSNEVGGIRVVHARYYQKLEAGEINPTSELLFILAVFLGTTVSALTDVSQRPNDADLPDKRPRQSRRRWEELQARRQLVVHLIAEKRRDKKNRKLVLADLKNRKTTQ